MTTLLVTRHEGARHWIEAQGTSVDKVINHISSDDVLGLNKSDVVIGTLPVQIAAAVCDMGARYLHLTLDVPPELRGQELSSETMEKFNARIEQYVIRRVPSDNPQSSNINERQD